MATNGTRLGINIFHLPIACNNSVTYFLLLGPLQEKRTQDVKKKSIAKDKEEHMQISIFG